MTMPVEVGACVHVLTILNRESIGTSRAVNRFYRTCQLPINTSTISRSHVSNWFQREQKRTKTFCERSQTRAFERRHLYVICSKQATHTRFSFSSIWTETKHIVSNFELTYDTSLAIRQRTESHGNNATHSIIPSTLLFSCLAFGI